MVHGILQFTPSIAFRYVLHQSESGDIRCRESLWFRKKPSPSLYAPRAGERMVQALVKVFLGASRAGDYCQAPHGKMSVHRFDNDTSTDSPIETFLQLFLPLNDKVQ
ncbi:hypothetical protein LIER_17126 [Lithospermum erythrorhizon]|uniref:Uncharacterized protein n=1 Tax=Lithospermum erythrorhizon TaxID=34254 RepID=A0AAV3QBS1_LITER